MTDAIRQLTDILWETTDILRIYAEPFAYNTGSRRALEKAGFAPTDTEQITDGLRYTPMQYGQDSI